MVAHVSDFGISRLVLTIGGISHKDTSTIGIMGTIGYAPPGMFLSILVYFGANLINIILARTYY
jgi:glycerate kinase